MKRDYFMGLGGFFLLGLSAFMIYKNIENWGFVMVGGILLIGSTTISKKDQGDECEKEEEE